MTAIILPSTTMSTLSTTTTNKAAPGIKLAPFIRQANVVSFERRQGKMWFIIHVDPHQINNNNHTGLKRHAYTIARRYDDCVQFSQRLYDAFPLLNESKTLLFKLKPQGLLNKKQSNGQRRAELDRFVQALFRLPTTITRALIVLEFFGLQKSDTEQQVLRDKQNLVRQQQAIVNSTANHQMYVGGDYSFFDDPFYTSTMNTEDDASTWASKFKTFRGRSPSSNSLSSFCTQAAHRLPWTPQQPKKKISFSNTSTCLMKSVDDAPGLMSCSSSTTSSNTSTSTLPTYYQQQQQRRRSSTRTSHCSNQSGVIPSVSSWSDPTISSAVRTMKLKVIYDVDNIVVIQIPRSTNLAALRTRLHDKFSTMLDPSLKPLADQFVLLYNENTRTSSSSSSELHLDQLPTTLASSPSITLISSEQQWANAMKTWDTLEKVTLRCIH
ncbi:hypothetical protein BC941DRAFT_438402 [Chlamydoabsidia padenii]|nr:hypothetical protein BC941DRAFT_438402 [Chlamydoabsidia padenii]